MMYRINVKKQIGLNIWFIFFKVRQLKFFKEKVNNVLNDWNMFLYLGIFGLNMMYFQEVKVIIKIVIIIEKVESFLVEYFKVFVIIDIFLLNWKR